MFCFAGCRAAPEGPHDRSTSIPSRPPPPPPPKGNAEGSQADAGQTVLPGQPPAGGTAPGQTASGLAGGLANGLASGFVGGFNAVRDGISHAHLTQPSRRGSRLPGSTDGGVAPDVRFSEEKDRRRALFDLLVDGTADAGLLGGLGMKAPKIPNFKAAVEKVIRLEEVLPWLNDQEDAKILGEMWAVLGMSGPLPRQTKDALAALKDTFKHMETAAGSKSISFEFFTRFIQKTRSDSTVDASLIGMDLEAGFKGNVVGLDARDVPNDAMVLLVQVRELRKVIAKDAALAPNPYLKVTLSGCSVAEKWRGVDGKQTKQSQAYGASSGNVAFDPPEYFGFVCAPADVPKAKVIVTLMDKNMVFADTILGSAVFPLKKMGSSGSSSSLRDRSGSNMSSLSTNSAATTNSNSSSPGGGGGRGGGQANIHEVVLRFSDPDTGDTLDTKVSLGLGLRSKSEGFGFGIERVFELQRWRPEQIHSPWGSSDKHLLPADPGKWSASPLANSSSSSSKDSKDSKGSGSSPSKSNSSSSSPATVAHFWTLDEASQLLPPGWSADPWRASAIFGDGGWQYSTAFRYTKWADEKSLHHVVRRRLWYRCIYGYC